MYLSLSTRSAVMFSAVAAGIVVTSVASSARAALLAAEEFNYTAGASIVGQTPPTGFKSWTRDGSGNGTITSGLTYPGLAVSGNALAVSDGNRVDLVLDTTSPSSPFVTNNLVDSNGYIGAPGTTIYVGFLFHTATAGAWQGLEFLAGGTSDPNRNFMIGEANSNGINVWTTPYNPTTKTSSWNYQGWYVNDANDGKAQDATTYELALGITYGSNGTASISGYLNPTPGSTTNTAKITKTGITDSMKFNTIALASFLNNSYVTSVDEIRLGTTLADVVPAPSPVPEPASLALLALVAPAILLKKRG